MMTKVNIVIPDELSKELKTYQKEIPNLLAIGLRELKIKQALLLFKEGDISLWKAARTAGVSLREMTMHAISQGLRPKIDKQVLKEELI